MNSASVDILECKFCECPLVVALGKLLGVDLLTMRVAVCLVLSLTDAIYFVIASLAIYEYSRYSMLLSTFFLS